MLSRLLLTVSLFGAWSLPSFGCGGTHGFDVEGFVAMEVLRMKVLRKADFDKATQQVSGGGTWHDSEGREGTFSSQLSTVSKKMKECGKGLARRIGCSETALFHRYSIELDDGRSEWFKWTRYTGGTVHVERVVPVALSDSGAVDMRYVRHVDEGDSRTIKIATDGDYTLTLVEEKIKTVPNSINLFPSFNVKGIYDVLRKMEIDRDTIRY